MPSHPSKVRKFTHTFTPNPSSNPSSHATTLSPALQTSLLHVGMRIRKSIASGYRTGWDKTYSCFPGTAAAGVGVKVREDERVQTAEESEEWVLGSQDLGISSSSTESASSFSSSSSSSFTESVSRIEPKPSKKRTLASQDDDDVPESEGMDARSTCLRVIAQPASRKRVVRKIVRKDFFGNGRGEMGLAEFGDEEVGWLDERNWIGDEL